MSNWLKRHRLVSIFLAGILLAVPSAVVNYDLLISTALAVQKKVSELTALTGANTASDDDFLIIDTSATQSKRITRDELGIGLGGPMGIVVESVPGTNPTATGTDAIGIGDGAVASGNQSISIGNNADATGANCIAIGGNATDDESADCSAADSIAIGRAVLADDVGEFAFASGSFAGQSDAHTAVFVLRNSTQDSSQTELFADGSIADISVPSNCTISFRINVVGRRIDVAGTAGAYLLIGVIENNAGVTSLVGTVGQTVVAEDNVNWDATVTADDVNDSINVLVTAQTNETVRWVARAEIAEACG